MRKNFENNLYRLVESYDADHRGQIGSLLEAGVSSYSGLLQLVQNRAADKEIRLTACWILARLPNKRAARILLAILKDGEEVQEIRQAAAISLGLLGSKRVTKSLMSLLSEEKDSEIRESIVYALGFIGDKRAVDAVINVLGDRDEAARVRGQAAEVLAYLRDRQAVEPLLVTLEEESVEIRFWAVFALGELGDRRALPRLERLAASDECVLPGWWAINIEAASAIEAIKSSDR